MCVWCVVCGVCVLHTTSSCWNNLSIPFGGGVNTLLIYVPHCHSLITHYTPRDLEIHDMTLPHCSRLSSPPCNSLADGHLYPWMVGVSTWIILAHNSWFLDPFHPSDAPLPRSQTVQLPSCLVLCYTLYHLNRSLWPHLRVM